mmetsp:Transcript_24990/g.38805  ORF Transcript_24990/g.38805 Transcript_24990/m.38805 type:complete len:164 (-) Transcript_24990:602-1093(-)
MVMFTLITMRAYYSTDFHYRMENELWYNILDSCCLMEILLPFPLYLQVQVALTMFSILTIVIVVLNGGKTLPFNFQIGHIAFSVCLVYFHYFREMNERKAYNYSRILKIEVSRTKDLIHKLVPLHALPAILAHEEHVDQFEDLTLLFTDMVGFTAFSKAVSEP